MRQPGHTKPGRQPLLDITLRHYYKLFMGSQSFNACGASGYSSERKMSEREAIIQWKWIASQRAGYDIGFERSAAEWWNKNGYGPRPFRDGDAFNYYYPQTIELTPGEDPENVTETAEDEVDDAPPPSFLKCWLWASLAYLFVFPILGYWSGGEYGMAVSLGKAIVLFPLGGLFFGGIFWLIRKLGLWG